MTSESQARQPSKRFAKLDAIPRHKRASGLRATAARLHIARSVTLPSAVAVLLAVGVGAAFLRSPDGPPDQLEVAIAEVARSGEIAKGADAVITPDPVQADISQSEVLPGDDQITPTVTPMEDGENEAASAKVKPNGEKQAPVPVQEDIVVGEQPVPVRKIIPISEGLDLHRDVGIPSKPIAVTPVLQERQDFTLPTDGVPTENELAGFLSPSASSPGEIEIIPPAEDLSPTIALPETVPVPTMKPMPELSRGTKVEFHIVQGPGVKSGFWLGNREDPNSRRFFVVVSPRLANGDSTNWKFTNIADGSPADTDRMAVEVTEDAFVALARESKEFGSIKDPVLGRGEVGGKAVKWRIDSIGGNLIAGWDRETRK